MLILCQFIKRTLTYDVIKILKILTNICEEYKMKVYSIKMIILYIKLRKEEGDAGR